MKLFLLTNVVSLALAFPVGASSIQSQMNIPITASVVDLQEIQQNGEIYSVATVEVSAGNVVVKTVGISCEAKNNDGFTWTISGEIRNITAGTKRTGRLVSEALAPPSGSATSINCLVHKFDTGSYVLD